jgi:hypothetical protein
MLNVTVEQATAEVFFAAFKGLEREEQESLLTLIARDNKLRRILEDVSDRQAIKKERNRPSKPLRDYIETRERREHMKSKAGR